MRNLSIVQIVFVLCVLRGQAQDLEPLLWKNRVVLLYTQDLEHPEYRKMQASLLSDTAGGEARKLAVFTILGDSVSAGLPPEDWKKRKAGVAAGPDPVEGFSLVFIGLDGGVKFRSTTAVSTVWLWNLIDSMPMRRSEIRNKGNP